MTISRARIKDDGLFNSADLGDKNDDVAVLTEEKRQMIEEYHEKIEEFRKWKLKIETDLRNVTFNKKPLNIIKIDDEVLLSNKQRFEKIKIIDIFTENDMTSFVYKKFNIKNNLGRKEFVKKIISTNDLPFYSKEN